MEIYFSFFSQTLVDWRRYNELRLQLDSYITKADNQLNENQNIGTTVTELEEQIEKHRVSENKTLVVKITSFSSLTLLTTKDEISRPGNLTFLWSWILRWVPRPMFYCVTLSPNIQMSKNVENPGS